ncbi:MAG: peptidylprolyl isomerase [Desulfurivibrionaceae bacterium]|nr:peptidylprolyl isomerase [Desulfobulbales bacterium]MDT8335339.1 peptidylprolyl isomerase [Desulfurivibrionaceae bacterium]
MRKVKTGDYVTIIYEGALKNGEIFESATEESPFEFTVGRNTVFPSFESGVLGMQAGETRTVTVNPEEAYGPRLEELVQTFKRDVFGDRIDPKPGMVVGMTVQRDGKNQQVPASIIAVENDRVTVDYNHPLAGEELRYRITLQAIAEAEGDPGADSGGRDSAGCGCN